ncbi:MAG: MoxR family ATPase [Verrucomicrobia bacterium]|nr:MoxR family ATPase [Verrucomicrobiota bacterium]
MKTRKAELQPMSEAVQESPANAQEQARDSCNVFNKLKTEVHKAFVGQDEIVESVLSVLLSDGHVLLEGVPGLGKTLLAHTLAQALHLDFSRIQFTPDLMPADIVGTMVLHEKEGGGHELRFQEGPVISNFILADEINRATPKTQSAMLEAVQERQVSVARQTIRLPEPFIVIATQNPVEQDGTYPLPEAQLDRFMVKLMVNYPAEEEYLGILRRTTGTAKSVIEPVSSGPEIMRMRHIVRSVPVSEQVQRYAVRLVMATQPKSPYATATVNRAVALGSSPRGIQSLILMGKVRALISGRFAVSCQDIRDVAVPVLRHRVMLSFEGFSERINPDELIREIVKSLKELSD